MGTVFAPPLSFPGRDRLPGNTEAIRRGRLKRLKVLIVTSIYPAPGNLHHAPYNRQAFEALGETCDVRVISPRPWWSRRTRLPRGWTSLGRMRVIYPTAWLLPRVGARWHGKMLYRSVAPVVGRLGPDWRPDVVMGVWAYPDGEAAVRIGRDIGCPVVINVIGSAINAMARRASLRPIIADTLRRAEHVIALSRELRDRVIELGVDPDRTTVQSNAVDGTLFQIGDKDSARRALNLPRDVCRLVLFVGNLVPEKGPDVLLEAFDLLAEGDASTHLAFVGDGTLRRSLERRCSGRGRNFGVLFAGRQEPAAVARWMQAADVVCIPSFREGCPNAMLESLASGRPVVASRVGGIPDVVGDGRNGRLVEPGSPDQFGAALTAALERRWHPEVLRASVPYLSWSTFALGLVSIFDKLLEGPVETGAEARD
jgi:glycosyltransferase involved in cell wall biosynthesis